MAYRLVMSGGRVTCDKCGSLIDSCITEEEYNDFYSKTKDNNKDLCDDCSGANMKSTSCWDDIQNAPQRSRQTIRKMRQQRLREKVQGLS